MRSPGTISLREETFQALLTDIAHSLKMHGFKNIIMIGDSGGNQAGQKAVADKLTAQFAGAAFVATIPGYYTAPPGTPNVLRQLGVTKDGMPDDGLHDSPGITLNMMLTDPELGALGSARQGEEGHHQRRRHLEPESIPRMGARHRRGPRHAHRGADQAGNCGEEVRASGR